MSYETNLTDARWEIIAELSKMEESEKTVCEIS